MKRLLSPGFLWPLFIVALLMMSVGVGVYAVMATRSDGGVQPVADYYGQATHYDALARERAESAALGWQLAVTPGESQPGGLRTLALELNTAEGSPLDGLTGEVSIARPDGGAAAVVPFHAAGGAYAASLPMQAAGLWDVTVRAYDGTNHFTRTVRVEVSG